MSNKRERPINSSGSDSSEGSVEGVTIHKDAEMPPREKKNKIRKKFF